LENGRCPFLDGLEELPTTDQAKVLAWAKRLAAHEQLRRPPYAKQLDDGIFELRLSLRAGEHRPLKSSGPKECEIFMKTANHRRTSASNNLAHADLGDSLKRKLQNPEFRAAYDAEDKRIELVLQIIKLRQQRGMTQSDLAKAIGTRQANVSRLERFDANLTVGTLEKVAQALGVNLQIGFVAQGNAV
jgi:ribosome-binding protein aMBF1 (putative translation factor)